MVDTLVSRLNDEEARRWDRSKDISLFTKSNYSVFVGRNSEANDALVSTHSHPRCVWLHAEEGRGSHVVLCVEGQKNDLPDDILRFAAELAKRFSKSENGKVRYAYMENVFKPQGFGKGVWKTRTNCVVDLSAV